jgi:hypothetical protein
VIKGKVKGWFGGEKDDRFRKHRREAGAVKQEK